MLLAELEIWHSRPIAPTRRVALGARLLPIEPAPGFGGLLLGGVVAAHIADLDDDLADELGHLLDDLTAGSRIPQPRLRHRFQLDRHGLARSRHRLLGEGETLHFEFEGEGSAASQVLGAAYAAAQVPVAERRMVMDVVRRGARWHGDVGPELVRYLSGVRGGSARAARAFADPGRWALDVLGFASGPAPARGEIQKRFRTLLRDAHPDHGGASAAAADRIAELSEARRILLSA